MSTPKWRTPTGMKAEHDSGFDSESRTAWQMVPIRGDRTLELDFATGKLVKNVTPQIIDIAESKLMTGPSRLFYIKGKRWSREPGRIEVRDPATNRLETVLELGVKNQKQLSVSFHFVEDRAGDATIRKFEEVVDIVRVLNEIYTPQTNVRFRLGSSSLLKVNIDLGDVVDATTDAKGYLLTGDAHIYGKQMWKQIFATKTDKLAHFNVYFVPAENPNNRNDLLFYDQFNCVIEDGITASVEYILPHAIGRMLGCPPTSNAVHRHHLMYWGWASATHFNPRDGSFIPKQCANIINP